ncbi:phosphoribosyltransferase [Citricoccus sp. GCM10030269]|uniref:phosphoribosyltransferase n=1 Tax=Citricoccus sp. GCM10030269 TaxID=3273388 RepID=UPI003620A40C
MAEFLDRYEAGQRLGRELAGRLEELAPADVGNSPGKLVVLGLPRGGVPVAEVVARQLGAPLDVIMVRKLGVPVHPELAMGALGERGARVLDESIVRHFAVTPDQLEAVERQEQETLERRSAQFRAGREPVDLARKTAVIVDDGMATGATARVACQLARKAGAEHVVLAVSVAARDTVEQILANGEADDVVVLATPRYFRSVGEHYSDFSPVSDDTVAAILRQA